MITRFGLLLKLVFFFSLLFSAITNAGIQDYFASYLDQKVEEFTLDNGMKFILLQRPQTPVFAAILCVKAGSVDEPLGKTGIAHVFEHMAFKGTTTIGTKDYEKESTLLDQIEKKGFELTKARQTEPVDSEVIQQLERQLEELHTEQMQYIKDNEFDLLYSKNGARIVNAGTGQDTTTYMVTLPKNHLELWARLEADRLLNPVFRQFYKERDVIMEERRMGVDSDPNGQLWEEFAAAAYMAHPYGDPVIGWMDDIKNLTIGDARQFHEKFYVASNITICIVGDIELKELKKVSEKYFGLLPADPKPEVFMPVEPQQTSVRTVSLKRDAQPQMFIGWHMPVYPNADALALETCSQILASGRTSRLYKRLILNEKIAFSVDASTSTLSRYPGLFTIDVQPKPDVTSEQILAVVFDELDKLQKEPPTEIEMQRVKKNVISQFLRGIETNFFLALQLAYFDQVLGNWKMMGQYLGQIEEIDAGMICENAKKYLARTNYTVGILEPESPEIGEKTSEFQSSSGMNSQAKVGE